MHSEVKVKFSESQQFRMSAADSDTMSLESARDWLDRQYNLFECEPLNPVGKILSADKVLCVARAAGPQLFAESDWAHQFAQATVSTLRRPVVRIDVDGMTIGY